jgi:hypothetical protein
MEKEILAALIGLAGAVVGAAIAGTITFYSTRSTNKLQEQIAKENSRLQQRAFLDGMMLKMLEFLMEYPHLEKDDFCQKYPAVPGDQNAKERYECFCCFVFNYLMMAFNHFEKDGKKVREYIHIEETLRKHHKWWQHDKDNLYYDDPFRQFIQTIIDELRKKGEIQ